MKLYLAITFGRNITAGNEFFKFHYLSGFSDTIIKTLDFKILPFRSEILFYLEFYL